MSVRPIDFNGMLQQTHEVITQKTNEDNQGTNIQQNVTIQQEQREQQQAHSVQTKDNAGGENYSLNGDGGGNGRGLSKKKSSDKDGKGDKKKFADDGAVFIKNRPGGFNITI